MATTIMDASLYARELQHNDQELLGDAEILYAHGRWARAFALAVLAQEEAGKALLAIAEQNPQR